MKYWIISPYDSDKKELFEYARAYDFQNGTIAIGWSELGDIRGISDEELMQRIEALPYEIKDSKYVFDSFTRFYKEISLGDIVVARKGVKQIIGIGEVSKTAYFNKEEGKKRTPIDDDNSWLAAHFIGVKWTQKIINLEGFMLPRDTIVEVTPDKKYYSHILNLVGNNENTVSANLSKSSKLQLLNAKKQIILYGPPGTAR